MFKKNIKVDQFLYNTIEMFGDAKTMALICKHSPTSHYLATLPRSFRDCNTEFQQETRMTKRNMPKWINWCIKSFLKQYGGEIDNDTICDQSKDVGLLYLLGDPRVTTAPNFKCPVERMIEPNTYSFNRLSIVGRSLVSRYED